MTRQLIVTEHYNIHSWIERNGMGIEVLKRAAKQLKVKFGNTLGAPTASSAKQKNYRLIKIIKD